MSNEIQAPVLVVKNYPDIKAKRNENTYVMDYPADTYEAKEKKKLPTLPQIIFAGSSTKLAFPKLLKLSETLPKKLENAIKTVRQDYGKTFNGFSKKLSANIKYSALAALTIATFGFFMKDSDNDGKLDILEGVRKYLLPE